MKAKWIKFCKRGRKRCKRCFTNLSRTLKRIFTCRGRMPRCCRRCWRNCKKASCWGPICRRCNLCERCRMCTRKAFRCCCRPIHRTRRVPHVEYYKVKKRWRMLITGRSSEDHNQVYFCTVNSKVTEDSPPKSSSKVAEKDKVKEKEMEKEIEKEKQKEKEKEKVKMEIIEEKPQCSKYIKKEKYKKPKKEKKPKEVTAPVA